MTANLLESTVGELVTQRPARSRVFEIYGIDYCCGGKKPLQQACAERQVSAEAVLDDLARIDAASPPAEIDWTTRPMSELADHIVDTHHAYLKRELPRLEYLVGRVTTAHGARHAELPHVLQVFSGLKQELESHLMKEERILFPLIRQLEAARERFISHCGSVSNPILMMEHEHDDAGNALESLRSLTSGYAVPDGACNTYRAMLSALAELEADLHQHIHKENNILFPAAARRERELNA